MISFHHLLKSTTTFLFIISLIAFGCSGRFVKKEKLSSLNEKYSGEYITIKNIDIGNNETMKAGTRIKIYFASGSDSIKVYAYPANQPRENAIGNNILYLFDTDFTKKKFSEEKLEESLKEIIKPVS